MKLNQGSNVAVAAFHLKVIKISVREKKIILTEII